MEYLLKQLINLTPAQYVPILIVVLLSVLITLLYVKLKEALSDIDKLKNGPHICLNKDIIDKVNVFDSKLLNMEERIDKVDVEFAAINTKLLSIDSSLIEMKRDFTTFFQNLSNQILTVASKTNKK